MIYFYIGFTLAILLALPWIYILSQMIIEALRGYVKNEIWVKPKLFFALYPKQAYYTHSWSYEQRRKFEHDDEHIMNGNMIWAFWALGFFIFTLGTIIVWPITITVLVLKGLRTYNTNEHFRKLFERKPRPVKVAKPKKAKVIKGLDEAA